MREVADVTGFPEIMDGRVKTLHPKIHGGLLGRRGTDEAVMAREGIAPIDLLVVNLYPFAATIAKPDVTYAEAIENIDVGGPAMLRAAAKNHADVTVVVDPADYAELLASWRRMRRDRFASRARLAAKAFAHTAAYDALVADYLARQHPRSRALPAAAGDRADRIATLRYGENPHQRAAFYRAPGAAPDASPARAFAAGQGTVVQQHRRCRHRDRMRAPVRAPGLRDRQARQSLRRGDRRVPARGLRARVPHRSDLGLRRHHRLQPAARCGYGAADPGAAVRRSDGGARAAAGGARGAGRQAQYARAARPASCSRRCQRSANCAASIGGVLVQDRDTGRVDIGGLRCVTTRQPTAAERRDLPLPGACAKYVKSNAIVFARDDATVGVGAGQMSRVYSSRIGAIKAEDAGLAVRGAVLASDAFFPFRDGVDVAASQGVTAIIQPGGSKRDDEVIAAADEHGLAMLFTGMRHFRH